MAIDFAINTEKTQKFINDLEDQKTILSSCTQLFTTLTSRFTSLQQSLALKSQILDSKFQALQPFSSQTLESLSQRESSIPELESATAAKIEELKVKALAEFEKPVKFDDLSDCLKSISRKMDASGLLSFVISKRKEAVALKAEIAPAIMEAVDPVKLILDAVEDFVNSKIEKVGFTDKRWACGMLVQVPLPEEGGGGGGGGFGGKDKGPSFSRVVVERAGKILEKWKDEKGDEVEGGGGRSTGGVVGPAEAVMFLQMVVVFGLKLKCGEDYLRKLVMENAARREMAKLAVAIGFGQKMEEMIDELITNGKEIEAVYFASESGLTDRFPPVSLLKSYLTNTKSTASNLKNGSLSATAMDEVNRELKTIKGVIRCVEDHKLESDFPMDSLRKRIARLEKTKTEKKKNPAGVSAKSQNKRGGSASGGRDNRPPAFRPGKAAKYSNAYSPFGRRNPVPLPQHSPVSRYSTPYNYPSQTAYDGHSAVTYISTYGGSHGQSPAVIPQQHYSLPVDDSGGAGFLPGASYGGQAGYGSYDYGTGGPSPYQQPSSYTQ